LLDDLLGVEVGDLAGEADREAGGVEGGDGADAAGAGPEGLPHGRGVLPKRGEDAEAGDDRATGSCSHGSRRGPRRPPCGAARPSVSRPGCPGRRGHGPPALGAVPGGARFARPPSRYFISPEKTKLWSPNSCCARLWSRCAKKISASAVTAPPTRTRPAIDA